jgi:uncharacterized protein YcfL
VTTHLTSLAALLTVLVLPTISAAQDNPSGVASKLMLRGEASGMKVAEMRMVRRSDVLVVEADLLNTENKDRTVYYRFRWLDGSGMQVGDGDPWKQMLVMGQESKIVKGIAPSGKGVDFRLEMNVEK